METKFETLRRLHDELVEVERAIRQAENLPADVLHHGFGVSGQVAANRHVLNMQAKRHVIGDVLAIIGKEMGGAADEEAVDQ